MAESPLTADTKYRLLLDISQQLSRTFELQALLDHLLAAVRTAVSYDAAGIFVLNRHVPPAQRMRPNLIAGMASVGFDAHQPEDDPMLRSGRGIIGHVIATGETVIAPDVLRDPHYVEGRHSTRSELAVPIVSGGRILGALNLESDRPDAFTAQDAELLEFFAVAAALSIEKAVLHRQVLDKQRLEQQLAIARDVQASLLPAAPPELPAYDVAGLNLPTWETGGDYFDYIGLPGGRLGLVVADVSGKGVPAALIMATFRAALRTVLQKEADIGPAIHEVNRVLVESMDDARFVTAVYGVLDPPSGTLTYLNCGHNPPLLVRAGGQAELLEVGGPALGLFGGRLADTGEVTIAPGDLLALYTDGVVEVNDPALEEFGLGRLERLLRATRHLPAAEVIRDVVDATRAHAGRESYEDDFTLVVVKRSPGDAPA